MYAYIYFLILQHYVSLFYFYNYLFVFFFLFYIYCFTIKRQFIICINYKKSIGVNILPINNFYKINNLAIKCYLVKCVLNVTKKSKNVCSHNINFIILLL